MRRVLVTGAGGFVGAALARRLCDMRDAGRLAFETLTLLDRQLPDDDLPKRLGVRVVEADICDFDRLRDAVAEVPDTVFHLAGVTSRAAEQDLELGLNVNLHASARLFELLRAQGHRPAVVFSSSIGVFGTPLPARIDDETPIQPTMSYGTAKRMVELLLADYSRRGELDGLSVRLPGIVARPAQPGGALSAFNSDLLRELAAGRDYVCPVSAEGTLWFMSLPTCVDNLLHAARVARGPLPASRALTLPVLRATVGEVVQAIDAHRCTGAASRVRYVPDMQLQAQFAQWPPLATPLADGLDFRHDRDLPTLIERALQD